MCTLEPGAGPGSLPAGGWPERPVWFGLSAPLIPCLGPQPMSKQPGWYLIWVLSPPWMTRHGLKRQAQGAEEGKLPLLAGEPLQLRHPPLAWLASPSSCVENQAHETRPGRLGAEQGRLLERAASLPLAFI